MTSSRFGVVAAVLAVALASSRAARADDSEAARHFDTGNELYKSSRFVEAEVELQKAWDLRQTFDVAANLGDCEVEIGQYRDAAEHLDFALKTLPISTKEGVRQRLRTRFELAKVQVGRVKIRVTPALATLIVNGRTYAPAPEQVFVEAGPVAIQAHLDGYLPANASLTVARGATQEVAVNLSPISGGGGGEPRRHVVLVGVIGGAATVAVAVTGLAFTLVAHGKGSDADDLLTSLQADHHSQSPCVVPASDTRCAQLKKLNDDADSFTTIGTVTFIGAGVLAAATLAYVFWPSSNADPAPAASASASRFRVTPSIGPGFGGATLRGAF